MPYQKTVNETILQVEEIRKDMIVNFNDALSNPEVNDKIIDIARKMKNNGNRTEHVLQLAGQKKSTENGCDCIIL